MDYLLTDESTGKDIEVSEDVLILLTDTALPPACDAIFDSDNVGLLGLPDDTPEYLQTWAHEGFNNHTGVDAVLGEQHEGAMLCAGYSMMEHDDE